MRNVIDAEPDWPHREGWMLWMPPSVKKDEMLQATDSGKRSDMFCWHQICN